MLNFCLKNKVALLLIFTAVSFGCKMKTATPTPILTYDEFYTANSQKLLLVDTTDSYQLRDVGIDTTTGGYYEFYKGGFLKSYNFLYANLKDSSAEYLKQNGESKISYSAYAEFYNASGTLDSIKNHPLVYSWIKISDSCIVNVRLFFFALNKQYDKISILTSNNKKYDLQPLPDTIFTNMQHLDFDVDAKGSDSIYMFVSAKYKNQNSGIYKGLNDTILIKTCSKKL